MRNLPLVHTRLNDVDIRSTNIMNLINEFKDNEKALIFADVPYLPTLRNKQATDIYDKEMTPEEHEEFLKSVKIVKSKVIICGYYSKVDTLYDDILLGHDKNSNEWHRYLLATPIKHSQRKEHKDKALEWVWTNYELPETAKHLIDLSKTDYKGDIL